MDQFYSAVSSICFTLLGFWFVVVQLGADKHMHDPQRRRTAIRVSLYFVLPGLMSVLSLVNIGEARSQAHFWRAVFLVTAAIGLVDAVIAARIPRTRVASVVTAVLYLGVAGVALSPTMTARLLPDVPPLAVEGVLLALLVLLGLYLIWSEFLLRARAAAE
jgi:hypothetical protein